MQERQTYRYLHKIKLKSETCKNNYAHYDEKSAKISAIAALLLLNTQRQRVHHVSFAKL